MIKFKKKRNLYKEIDEIKEQLNTQAYILNDDILKIVNAYNTHGHRVSNNYCTYGPSNIMNINTI